MTREAKELAKQREALEAALAAERVDAQGHGYTPTPLATPKPVKVGPANLTPSQAFINSTYLAPSPQCDLSAHASVPNVRLGSKAFTTSTN